MKIWQMKDAEFVRSWPWIAQLIEPAVRIDPNRTMQGLYDGVLYGSLGIASLHDDHAAAVLVVEPVGSGDDMVLWLPYLGGSVKGGPRRFLHVMRAGMAQMVKSARFSGCREVRMCGRDWSRVFPDFTPFGMHLPNALQKVIV